MSFACVCVLLFLRFILIYSCCFLSTLLSFYFIIYIFICYIYVYLYTHFGFAYYSTILLSLLLFYLTFLTTRSSIDPLKKDDSKRHGQALFIVRPGLPTKEANVLCVKTDQMTGIFKNYSLTFKRLDTLSEYIRDCTPNRDLY